MLRDGEAVPELVLDTVGDVEVERLVVPLTEVDPDTVPVTLGVRDTDEHTLALEHCEADILREGEAVTEAVLAPVVEVE